MGLDMWLTRAKDNSEAMYWRKANAVHGFFCEECNGGEEINCEEFVVTADMLRELNSKVTSVLETLNDNGTISTKVAEENLPLRNGFFFGTDQYDEWYVQDLKNTKEFLDKELEHPDESYLYYAWW